MDGQRVLEIVLSARDEASKKIDEIGKKVGDTGGAVNKLATSFKVAGAAMTGIGVAGAAMMLDWANKASEAQVEMAKVDALAMNMVKGNQKAYQALKEDIDEVSAAYVKLGFDDETTAMSFTKLIALTDDLDESNKMLALSADLARFKSIGLEEATQAVIMAYGGNTKILKQLGIEVQDHATKQEVLAAIQSKVAGQADSYSKTYAGAMERMNIQIDNLKETLGERLLPTMTDFMGKIIGVVDSLNAMDPRIFDLIVKITAFGTAFMLIAGPIMMFIGLIPAFIQGLSIIWAWFMALIALLNPVTLVIAAIIAVLGLLYLAWTNNFLGIQQIVANVVNFIINTLPTGIQAAVNWSLEVLGNFLGAVSGIFNNIRNTMLNAINSAVTGIVASITGLIKNIYDIKDKVIKAFQDMVSPIVAILQQIKFPHVSIGEGKANIAGHEVKYPTFNVAWYEKGGYVPDTGLAMLHAGEFVLSKDMLSGRRSPPADVSRTFNQPITINAVVGSGTDINMLGYQLAWILRNSR